MVLGTYIGAKLPSNYFRVEFDLIESEEHEEHHDAPHPPGEEAHAPPPPPPPGDQDAHLVRPVVNIFSSAVPDGVRTIAILPRPQLQRGRREAQERQEESGDSVRPRQHFVFLHN